MAPRERSIGYADGDGAPAAQHARAARAAAAEKRGEHDDRRRIRRATRWRAACAASTRAATRSTTRSRRCTSRCAAPIRTRRCTGCAACSTAAPIRSTSARRIVRMASEDIGLADPRALRIALDAGETYERLGSPEGELALARGGGLSRRRAEEQRRLRGVQRGARVRAKDGSRPVPMHLRNAPTKLMKEPGLRQGLSLCARRGGRLRGGRDLSARRHAPTCSIGRRERGLEARIGEKLRDLRARDDASGGRHAPPVPDED